MKEITEREFRIYSNPGRYTPAMVNACVQRGIAFLDERCPDWFRETDLDTLNLRDPWACMLGQMSECIVPESFRWSDNGYTRVLKYVRQNETYSESNTWARFHGFAIRPSEYGSYEEDTRWEMLQLAWGAAIRDRLALAEAQA